MVCQPTLYRRGFMSRGVVEHDVAVQVRWDVGIDFLEECQEFGGAVPGVQ